VARRLRQEEEGGLYHVLNRGNYRQWIFREEGAKLAFETTLFEACERAGWVLHAFCVMDNHYHLAVETPRGNLTDGMRWLQSVYATRFNRFRNEQGHLFQGRFKSLAVEDSARLGWLCHYIHLNPVRAGLCEAPELAKFRWSSTWYLERKKERPAFLEATASLDAAGELADTPAGVRSYWNYLAWLTADASAQKEHAFDRMSRGWAIGSKGFLTDVARADRRLRVRQKLTQAEARAARETVWTATLEACLKALEHELAEAASAPKAADWKVAIATYMKRRMLGTNAWLAGQLHMGTPFGVSRYAAEVARGDRPGAGQLVANLTTRVKQRPLCRGLPG